MPSLSTSMSLTSLASKENTGQPTSRSSASSRHYHNGNNATPVYNQTTKSHSSRSRDRPIKPLQERVNKDNSTANSALESENVIRRSDSLSSLFSVFRSVSIGTSGRHPNRESGVSLRSTSSGSPNSATVATVLGSSSASRRGLNSFYAHGDRSSSSISLFSSKSRSKTESSDKPHDKGKKRQEHKDQQSQSMSDLLQRRRHLASNIVRRATADQPSPQKVYTPPSFSEKDSDSISITSTASSRLRKFSQKFKRGSGFSAMCAEPAASTLQPALASRDSHPNQAKKSLKVQPMSALRHMGSSSQLSTRSKAYNDENGSDELRRALYSVEDLTAMENPNTRQSPLYPASSRNASYEASFRRPQQKTYSPLLAPAAPQTVSLDQTIRSVSDVSATSSNLTAAFEDSSSVSSSHTSPFSVSSNDKYQAHPASMYSEKMTPSPVPAANSPLPMTGGVCWIGENGIMGRTGFSLDDSEEEDPLEYVSYPRNARHLSNSSMSALPQSRTLSGSIKSRTSYDSKRYSNGSYGSSSMRSSGHDWRTDIAEEDTLRVLAM
ncbi:uncharacterized protein V2V93DRAFT_369079 [Kockiozyma suomiensis]|uniref:uncharacterized protein n=1 Tax=Kockiozyma suomiensis TaxID=1337062 RepID=UPI0033437402